jgi:predicted nucleic-acid-binding protein
MMPIVSPLPAADAVYLDTSVVLRYLTRAPAEMAVQAQAVILAAKQGGVVLRLTAVTVAETVWTLRSFYRLEREAIAQSMIAFVAAEGIETEAHEEVMLALSLYRDRDIDFADALLAARALLSGPPIIYSFDRRFDRIPGIRRQTPGDVL